MDYNEFIVGLVQSKGFAIVLAGAILIWTFIYVNNDRKLKH